MTPARERVVVLALGVAGGAFALLTATRPWLLVTVKDPLVGSGQLHPTGRNVAALVPAAALVALAASVAAVTMRRVGRQVAGLLLVSAGAAMAAAAARVLMDAGAAAQESVRQATGRTAGLSAVTVTATVWPWLAIGAAALVVLAGAVTVVRGRQWSGLSPRYDAPAATVDPADDDAAWDALSRGEDPTR